MRLLWFIAVFSLLALSCDKDDPVSPRDKPNEDLWVMRYNFQGERIGFEPREIVSEVSSDQGKKGLIISSEKENSDGSSIKIVLLVGDTLSEKTYKYPENDGWAMSVVMKNAGRAENWWVMQEGELTIEKFKKDAKRIHAHFSGSMTFGTTTGKLTDGWIDLNK